MSKTPKTYFIFGLKLFRATSPGLYAETIAKMETHSRSRLSLHKEQQNLLSKSLGWTYAKNGLGNY